MSIDDTIGLGALCPMPFFQHLVHHTVIQYMNTFLLGFHLEESLELYYFSGGQKK